MERLYFCLGRGRSVSSFVSLEQILLSTRVTKRDRSHSVVFSTDAGLRNWRHQLQPNPQRSKSHIGTSTERKRVVASVKTEKRTKNLPNWQKRESANSLLFGIGNYITRERTMKIAVENEDLELIPSFAKRGTYGWISDGNRHSPITPHTTRNPNLILFFFFNNQRPSPFRVHNGPCIVCQWTTRIWRIGFASQAQHDAFDVPSHCLATNRLEIGLCGRGMRSLYRHDFQKGWSGKGIDPVSRLCYFRHTVFQDTRIMDV